MPAGGGAPPRGVRLPRQERAQGGAWSRTFEESGVTVFTDGDVTGETTGGDVWEGGLALARFVTQGHAYLVSGKAVLELGAGTGLLGLWLGAMAGGGPARVVLTDIPTLLPLLRRNTEHNRSALRCDVRVEPLDWNAPPPAAVLEAGPFDLVVAAEVLYMAECAAPLLQTLLTVTAPGAQIVLALSCRFKEVEKSFFDAAAADFEMVDETASAPDVEDLLASDVSIFRLTRKAA